MVITHTVKTWFRVPAGKTIGYTSDVDIEVSGKPYKVEIDGHQVWTSFPDFDKDRDKQGLGDPETGELFAVAAFRVFAASFFLLPDGATDNEIRAEAYKAAERNQVAATRLVDALRIASPNTGLVGTRLEGLTWTYNRSPDGVDVDMTIRTPARYAISGYPSLPLSLADRVMSQGPDIVSVLMAQATFNIRHSVDPNPQLAVLLAAIACEVHATKLIEATVEAADADMVRRYYKVAGRAREPKEKYGKLSKVLWSKSLEAEHPELWKKVVELFAVRHKIAHSGALVDLDVGEPLVYRARLAIHWLTLVSEGKDSTSLPIFPIV